MICSSPEPKNPGELTLQKNPYNLRWDSWQLVASHFTAKSMNIFTVYRMGIVRYRRRRQCHRRLCRQHFQMTSLKLLGKLKPNYIWGLHGVGGGSSEFIFFSIFNFISIIFFILSSIVLGLAGQ